MVSCSDGESSARSYSDAARSPPAPPRPTPAAPSSPVTRASPLPPPPRRAPASTRLGPRSEVHRVNGGVEVDADGFQQPRRRRRRPRRAAPRTPPRPRSPSPEATAGLCFRCLGPGHPVRDCTNDIRCRRCLYSGHGSRACWKFLRGVLRADLRAVAPPAVAHQVTAPQPPPRDVAPLPPPPPCAPSPIPVDPERVIISRSVEMEEAEAVLRRGMVASITGARPAVSAGQVEDVLYSSFDLLPGDFTIHSHHPEDFLIVFSTDEIGRASCRERV